MIMVKYGTLFWTMVSLWYHYKEVWYYTEMLQIVASYSIGYGTTCCSFVILFSKFMVPTYTALWLTMVLMELWCPIPFPLTPHLHFLQVLPGFLSSSWSTYPSLHWHLYESRVSENMISICLEPPPVFLTHQYKWHAHDSYVHLESSTHSPVLYNRFLRMRLDLVRCRRSPPYICTGTHPANRCIQRS